MARLALLTDPMLVIVTANCIKLNRHAEFSTASLSRENRPLYQPVWHSANIPSAKLL